LLSFTIVANRLAHSVSLARLAANLTISAIGREERRINDVATTQLLSLQAIEVSTTVKVLQSLVVIYSIVAYQMPRSVSIVVVMLDAER
jgi:hypothetical protein